MRKDVRLGLAVGGILFGVVLIYTLFFAGDRKTTGSGDQQQASAEGANADNSTNAGAAGGQNPSRTDASARNPSGGSSVSPSGNGLAATSSGGNAPLVTSTPNSTSSNPGASATSGVTSTERRIPTNSAETASTTTPESSRNDAATSVAVAGPAAMHTPGNLGAWDWGKALNTGAQVPLLGQTETPGGGRDLTSRRNFANGASGTLELAPGTGASGIRESASTSSGIATSVAGKSNYVVKPGETFWTIAKSVYGDGAYVSHLTRANPKIDPKKLRAGVTITLPAKDEVVPPGATAVLRNTVNAPANLDASRQYRVRSGDNLSSISEKLYGDTTRVDKLYQLNKDSIGPNPSALKLGMVLQLPDSPTRNALDGAGTN